MAEHIAANARIEAAVLNDYLRAKVEPIFRKSALMGLLKSKGRITFGHTGKAMEWRPRYRRREIVATDGNPVSIDFPNYNLWKKAELPWRSYAMGASVNKYEKLVSANSKNAFFNLATEIVDTMAEDFVEDFRFKLYVDGGVAGSKDLHGLESCMSVSGIISGGRVGNPNDTYAGISTVLGYYGGDWTADAGDSWPTGTGDVEYHFWTPTPVVDYTNAEFAGATNTWSANWQKAIRYAITYGGILQDQDFDVILLHPELLRQAKDTLEGKQTLEVTQQSSLVKLGFSTLQFEGHELVTEYGVPSGVGYLLRPEKLELCSLQKQLVSRDSDRDITTMQDLHACEFYGNLKIEAPSFFAKLQAIS